MNETAMRRTLERIARKELEITTLERRGRVAEDFHSLAVWEIETVMEQAYRAGFEACPPRRAGLPVGRAAGKTEPAEGERHMEQTQNETPETHDAEVRAMKRRVSAAEDVKGEDVLVDALRDNLSPHAVAAIAAYLQPVRTLDHDVEDQVVWFRELLTTVVGGTDQMNRLCDEAGL